MEGQWGHEHNGNVNAGLDLGIGSPGEYSLMLQDLSVDLDGLLGLGENTNMGNNGDASTTAAEQDNSNDNERRADWRRRRHNRDQVHQLEIVFRENQHPDEKERAELARRLGITGKQVKFWFQNRRSSLKTQGQRKETNELREENESLKAERLALMSAIEDSRCLTCRGRMVQAGGTGRQQLLLENARLREEIQKTNAFIQTASGGTAPELMTSAMPSCSAGPANVDHAGKGKAPATDHAHPPAPSHGGLTVPDNVGFARSQRDMLADLAAGASQEFKTLVCSGTPMWMPSPDGQVEVLNLQTYIDTIFPTSMFVPYRVGVVVDGTRKTGDVQCIAGDLVGVLMNAVAWSRMFPGIVASASASVIVPPNGASRHEMAILMDAELRLLSPRVPLRKVKFIRQCRYVAADTWAVVDVSIDGILGHPGGGMPPTWTASRFLPSGCLIQGRSNSCSKVTWIVNMEHEETTVSPKYHPLLRSGQALGACRWLASLERQCQYLGKIHSFRNTADMMPNGRKVNIYEAAHQMTRSFYEAMCGQSSQPRASFVDWSGGCGVGVERFEVVARVVTYSVGNGAPREQAGAIVLSARAAVWLPGIPPQQVFYYLCDLNRRGEWDSLANDAPVHQEGCFETAKLPGNNVYVHRTMANGNLILQETCADTTCMVLAYAVMDEQAMQHALNNGGTASLPLLPSGVVILPDGASPVPAVCSSSSAISLTSNTGSLVSVMYQTLLNGQEPEETSLEAIDNAGNLLCRVIKNIKDAVHASKVITA
ncbi:hypothetical protein ACQ4PT_013384 [Festuca glaucescens]